MVGVIVGGFLGGRLVGIITGVMAGGIYAYHVGMPLAPWVFFATVLVGLFAGWWSRMLGTSVNSVIAGSLAIQLLYHVILGGFMLVLAPEIADVQTQNLPLHLAKIAANMVGVVLFMGLLNLTMELEKARETVEESEDIVRSARLEALQYQVNPHFLFNLLNTLSYLIRTDPPKARELTLDLSEFLRYTLSDAADETTLRKELEQIRRYVELERARFGDGLRFEILQPADDLVSDLVVPPLILQPLVENAIRHGARDGKVSVLLDVEREGDNVTIRVLDDGPGPPGKLARLANPRKAGGGVGLRNVQERLERFYHGEASFGLRPREGTDGACAEVVVPIRAGEHASSIADHARKQLKKALGEA
jgi:LytS/YehU family sensor histidine kinase